MPGKPDTVTTIAALRESVDRWRAAGDNIALVPTMGALHDGHLSLVELAKKASSRTVVSVFVNPSQFAPHEDFASYPRTLDEDIAKLAPLGTDLVFAPPREEVYREDFSTSVGVKGLTEVLCGKSRPHFFSGVATVVAKLFNQCRPDIAVFGEKDYQQLLVIRRMARDLDMNVEVIGGPIVRESDGLAMSSRNAYLAPGERDIAPVLYLTILGIAEALAQGKQVEPILEKAHAHLSETGFEMDYLEVRNAETLAPVSGTVRESARVFAAAMLGKTRLIDNVAVPGTKD